jgi:hypothetical protein
MAMPSRTRRFCFSEPGPAIRCRGCWPRSRTDALDGSGRSATAMRAT